MALQNLLKELAKLSPEERKALQDVFGPQAAAPAVDDGVDKEVLQQIKDDLMIGTVNLSLSFKRKEFL